MQLRPLDGDRHALGDDLEQLDLVLRELAAVRASRHGGRRAETPRTSSGTPTIVLSCFRRRIGLKIGYSSTSITIGRASSATRPAKPAPTGIRTPTSSSIPSAARATSSFVSSSSSRTAQVSVRRMSRILGRRTLSSSFTSRCASAASVTACTCSIRSRAARSASKRRACSIASAARSATSWSSSTSSSPEGAVAQRADVEDAAQLSFDHERDAEHRLDALLAQERVEDVGVVDVVEDHGPLLGGDPAREAAAHRDADALLYLFLDAERGARDELVVSSSSRRIAQVSTSRIWRVRSSSAARSSSRRRCARAASVTDCSRRTCSEVDASGHTPRLFPQRGET